MRLLNEYDTYIFDCDGVILDSNLTKIKAMELAISSNSSIKYGINDALNYFSENFGKSRYHHVDKFVDELLNVRDGIDRELLKKEILNDYSKNVEQSYNKTEIVDGFEKIINNINGTCYVASGSEQEQLRRVLKNKGLNKYFTQIYGSPVRKEKIISEIIKLNNTKSKTLMIGDSVADLVAAQLNSIDFIGIGDKSNTPSRLKEECDKYGYQYLTNWNEIINNESL